VRRVPREASTVCVCEPVIEAEIRYVLEHEFARDISGVARRTRPGLGARGGMRSAARCGRIVADALGLPPRPGVLQAARLLTEHARTRVVALGREQARQEAIAIAAARSQMGITPEALEDRACEQSS